MKRKLKKFVFILFLLLCNCSPWRTAQKDILLFSHLGKDELRGRLKSNDATIYSSFENEGISEELRAAVHDNIRIYSGCALSPSFNLSQIRISTQRAISFFNPTFRYIFVTKDDLEYFNIHGVLIHESVGHPTDYSVYPLSRFFDIVTFSQRNPTYIWELRAIACVSAIWQKIHQSLSMPYKPWNILHPVSGSKDCEDVFDWFFVDEREWHSAKNIDELKEYILKERTDSVPHLLARIYVLILSAQYSAEDLWQFTMKSNKIEYEVNQIILKNTNVAKAMNNGLQKRYLEYISSGHLNLKKITELLSYTKPIAKENLKVYSLQIGSRGIFWYDYLPYGLSFEDHITWKFSDFDVFEDQGADGPNDEDVLGNKDCHQDDYEKIWTKCSRLSEFILRKK